MNVRWLPTLIGLAIAFALSAFITKISFLGATCYAIGEVNIFGDTRCLNPAVYWGAWIVAVVLILFGIRIPKSNAPPAPASSSTPSPEPGSDVRMWLPAQANANDHVSKLLFLNRCVGDCIVTPGANDARFNTSSIVNGTSSITEFRHDDETWNAVVQCVKEVYAPYDVQVTDVDPGDSTFHHESIVAGVYTEIGYEQPAGGVAPFACEPVNNVISFAFANGYPADPFQICMVIAQESAHSYGLDHAFDCSDPMTYLPACGRQFFRDRNTPCGELEQFDQCRCGGSAQNSHRWLQMVLGNNPVPVSGPEVSILQPAPDSKVSNKFAVASRALDMRGVGHVDYYLNGTLYGTREGHDASSATNPYWYEVPADLADGIIDIEVRAYNDIEAETTAQITVTKGEPCETPTDCNDGQNCDNGRCLWPVPTGQLGDACTNAMECVSGLCPRAGEEAYCSQDCFPTPTENTCPDGFQCIDRGGNQGICWPEVESGSCGCTSAGSDRQALGLGACAIALLWFGRRRRSRT